MSTPASDTAAIRKRIDDFLARNVPAERRYRVGARRLLVFDLPVRRRGWQIDPPSDQDGDARLILTDDGVLRVPDGDVWQPLPEGHGVGGGDPAALDGLLDTALGILLLDHSERVS